MLTQRSRPISAIMRIRIFRQKQTESCSLSFHFKISDVCSRQYLQRVRARRTFEHRDAVQIAKATDASRLSKLAHSTAAAMSILKLNSEIAMFCTNAGNLAARPDARENYLTKRTPGAVHPNTRANNTNSKKRNRPLFLLKSSKARNHGKPCDCFPHGVHENNQRNGREQIGWRAKPSLEIKLYRVH